jgi:hypothetical protein
VKANIWAILFFSLLFLGSRAYMLYIACGRRGSPVRLQSSDWWITPDKPQSRKFATGGASGLSRFATQFGGGNFSDHAEPHKIKLWRRINSFPLVLAFDNHW